MTKVVSFVHEVNLIKNGYGIRKVVLRLFRVVKSVLDPCGYCRDEVHAEKRNQHEHDPSDPVPERFHTDIPKRIRRSGRRSYRTSPRSSPCAGALPGVWR